MIRQHYQIEDGVFYGHHFLRETRYRCLHCEAEGRRLIFCADESPIDFDIILDLARHAQEWHDVYMGL